MAQAAIPLAATAFSIAGQVQRGRAEKAAASSQAAQIEANAQRRLAEGKMLAQEETRKTARLMSDAQAIQASSGFSASDAQALKQIGDIAEVGKRNELAILYDARMDAEGMQREAAAARESGSRAQSAAYVGAFSTALGGYGDISAGFKSWQDARKYKDINTVGPLRSGYKMAGNQPGATSSAYGVGTYQVPFKIR
jgi:hypothetical protein